MKCENTQLYISVSQNCILNINNLSSATQQSSLRDVDGLDWRKRFQSIQLALDHQLWFFIVSYDVV
jgi:hypothetical protein